MKNLEHYIDLLLEEKANLEEELKTTHKKLRVVVSFIQAIHQKWFLLVMVRCHQHFENNYSSLEDLVSPTVTTVGFPVLHCLEYSTECEFGYSQRN